MMLLMSLFSSLSGLPKQSQPKQAYSTLPFDIPPPWQCVCCPVFLLLAQNQELGLTFRGTTCRFYLLFNNLKPISYVCIDYEAKIHLREPNSCHGQLHSLQLSVAMNFVVSIFSHSTQFYGFNWRVRL